MAADPPILTTEHAGVSANAASAFRPDIQGLRAIAVLSVVLFHAGRSFPSGGFAGVDIFFVISGYLITGILLGEMQQQKFSLTAFYERRVRRLFPALFTLLAVVLLVGLALLPPSYMKDLARNTFTTIFFASNFDFFSHVGYFDADAQNLPLLHTWSLAVEEQFYIFFPLLLFALYTFMRRRLRVALAILALVSLAACAWMVRHSPEAAFYLAPFRAFELLIGATIARLEFPATSQRVRDTVSLLGLAAIAAGLLLLREDDLFPGALALIPCLGAGAVLFAGAGGSSLGGRLISGPVFTYFGNLSYSLYLWHWPVLVFARFALLREPNVFESAFLVALSIALATLSWRFIERPFLKRRGNPWRAIGSGLALMAAGSAIAFALVRLQGAPQRFSPAAQQIFQAANDFSPQRERCHNLMGALRAYADDCVLGDSTATPHIAVWGDSYGVELAEALAERLGPRGQSLIEVTESFCAPAIGPSNPLSHLCDAQNRIDDHALLTDDRIQTIVFAAHFATYNHAQAIVLHSFARAVRAAARAGKRIILIDAMPIAPFDAPAALGLVQQRGQALTAYGQSRLEFEREAAIASPAIAALARETHAVIVHPAALLCDTSLCHTFMVGRGVLYFNRDHLSMAGARLLTEHIPL